MNTEHMQIGLSQALLTSDRTAFVHDCLTRLVVNGDPGDENDPDVIMHNISALMNNAPMSAVFEGEDVDIAIFLQPKQDSALVISDDELDAPHYRKALMMFGFNPETMMPFSEQ